MLRRAALALLFVACSSPPDDSGGGGGGGSTGGGTAHHNDAGTGGGGGAAPMVDCTRVSGRVSCDSPDQPGGLCTDSACLPCSDPADDAVCSTALGTAAICSDGACVKGSCRADADCNGKVCQLPSHTCVACAADYECPGKSCNRTSGTCVSAACATEGAACNNGLGVCCSGVCSIGNCCSSAQCTGADAGSACVHSYCTSCAPGADLCVDGQSGDDLLRGNSCCFNTLTRALETLIHSDGGTIVLRSDIAGASEAFPMRLPAGVTIGQKGVPSHVTAAPGAYAFVLSSPGSNLVDVSVLGGGGGVLVLAGTGLSSNRLDSVTVQNVTGDGVRVEGGGISIDGTFTQNLDGLVVIDGTARIAPTTTVSHFDGNRQAGISVSSNGAVIIDGNASTGANLTASNNGGSGLQILNTPGAVAPFQRVIGLTALGNTLDGVRLGANANISQFQGNVALGNHRAGVSVHDFSGMGTGLSLDGAGNPNTLQSTANPNLGAGLCFDHFKSLAVTADARHNAFGTADCSLDAGATPAALTRSSKCAAGVDIGGVTEADGGSPTSAHVKLDNCASF